MRNPVETDEAIQLDEVVDVKAASSWHDQGDSEASEDNFDGFDGTWDYEWVSIADHILEEWPWTWIAVVVFTLGIAYSYVMNKRR